MNKRMKPHDVVVGAAPAGSETAYQLARAGVRTLLMIQAVCGRDAVADSDRLCTENT
jgi:folate-dependent tRNA-U54 methylase TrmFO/GidA